MRIGKSFNLIKDLESFKNHSKSLDLFHVSVGTNEFQNFTENYQNKRYLYIFGHELGFSSSIYQMWWIE